MKLHFASREWDAQLLRALSYSYYGGSDVSECLTIASRIDEKQSESWNRAWFEAATTLFTRAQDASSRGNRTSSREMYLRASSYAKLSMALLYPSPHDARFLQAYDLHTAAFHSGITLSSFSVTPFEVPYHNRVIRGLYYRSSGKEEQPTILVIGGYTSTHQENFFSIGAEALRQGYNVVCFDGPGQGEMLYKQGYPMTYTWEEVLEVILDTLACSFTLGKTILIGLGWGSLLAARAAALEPRIDGLVTYPGHYDALLDLENFIPHLRKMLEAEDHTPIHQAFEKILSNKTLGNKFRARMWIHGVESVYGLLQQWRDYHVRDLGPKITCPTLVCNSESECLNEGQAKQFYDVLQCPKEYLFFSGVNGSGEHCEMGVSAAEHEQIFDWLASKIDRSSRNKSLC